MPLWAAGPSNPQPPRPYDGSALTLLRAPQRAEVNTLIKLAAERRAQFTRPQQERLDAWESERRAHPATRTLEYAKFLQDKPVL